VRVAVIGAGMAGLVAGYRLASGGHDCDVYERWPGLGGQVATLDVGPGDRLERYYHHLFTGDTEIVDLYDELGMSGEVEWHPSSVGVFTDGRIYPFTTPLDLLRFRPMSLPARIRMGLSVVILQRRHREVEPFERETARSWILRSMGEEAWTAIWGPMLRGKFGDRADDISMAWLWSKLLLRRQIKGESARREVLGYPRGGWEPLLQRLAERIEGHGGRVLIDRPAARLDHDGERFLLTAGAPDSFRAGHDPRRFPASGEPERYDAVVATVPNKVFERLLSPALAERLERGYLERLRSIEYHTALCVLMELDRSFSAFYWTNIADRSIPFVGLIEQTNFIEPARYANRRFLYVANYLAPGDPLLSLGPDELVERYEPGLRKVNPEFSRDWIRQRWVFQEPAAQPVVTVGYPDRIPPYETGVPGLMLANTTQIYPEDRGTSNSVKLGDHVARLVVDRAPASAVGS